MTFEESLDFLNSYEPDDYRSLKIAQENWKSLISEDRGNLERLYDIYFATIKGFLGENDALALNGVKAYNFILAFSGTTTVASHGGKEEAWRILNERHAQHLDLLRRAISRPNSVVSEKFSRTKTGTWADIVTSMLDLYYWHKPYSNRDETLRTEAAMLVPEIYRAFPEHKSFLLPDHLMLHPDAIREAGDLIRFYTLEKGQPDAPLLVDLAYDMFGFHSDKGKPAHAQSAAILQHALSDASSWTEQQLDKFLEDVIFTPLDIQTYSQQKAEALLQSTIANYERLLRENKYESHLGTSAQTYRERDEKSLQMHRATLNLIQTDFDAWNGKRRDKAVQRLAVSATTRKAFKVVKTKLPAPYGERIGALLDEVADYSNRPKLYPPHKPSENRFKDLGLKLLVIEQLMYQQKVLKPQFDIHLFAKEYEKREISVEIDGYEIIPEVETYFKNLAISDELLAKVETLHQSSGLDGGSEFIYHLYPFWDPGSGDEAIPVSDKAISDLELLPNLNSISGLENSKPSAKLLKALAARDIKVSTEE
ncbi:hypothetical protein [Neorhizobium sp. JUb45]|uniref:DUF6892 domain-containing protein n=1 Tax=Neorhizobium sp. JUb45 TaxID=2485113 RepID=UPI001050A79F|nr:hypothetical protein [Neorhizobium sp. JUb45]TCR03906.1 hypothetical protein EDF70_1021 [Neorhizobium sp. JUb45]